MIEQVSDACALMDLFFFFFLLEFRSPLGVMRFNIFIYRYTRSRYANFLFSAREISSYINTRRNAHNNDGFGRIFSPN